MKRTKTKLVSSIVTLLICFAMLIGSTFAWFTDSASTGVNKIQAGNLDLVVKHKNAKVSTYETIEDQTNLFKDANGTDMKWEPGAMSWETFKVSNEGSLAFKYVLQTNITGFNTINVNGTDKSLKDVLKVKVLEGSNILTNPTRETVAAMDWSNTNDTLDSFIKGDGKLYPIGTASQNSSEEFQVIVYWMPTANDNDWNVNNGKTTSDNKPLFIDFGIKVLATQLEHESDSFDNTYDKNATYSESVTATVVPGKVTKFTSAATPLNEAGATTTVEFPASVSQLTENSTPELTIVASPTMTANNKFTVSSGNGVVGAIDLTLTVDGNVVTNFTDGQNAVDVTVTTYAAKGLTNPKLYYNGAEVTITSYESTTGKLVFKTNHFSTYVLEAENEAYIVETDTAYNKLQLANNGVLSGQTIALLKDVEITEQINLPTNVTLDGRYHVIKANNASWSSDNSSKMLLLIGSSDTVKNITLDSNSQACGVQTYAASNVKLENVTLINSKNAGLLINASQVTVSGTLTMNGNKWGEKDANYINLGWGSGVTAEKATLTFEQNSSVEGVSMVWTDSSDLSHAEVTQDAWNTKFAVNGVFAPSKANGGIAFVEPVAKIGKNLYGSLNDAIIDTVPVDGKTVTINVLKDVTLDNNIANGNNSRNITFIGNGSQIVDVITNTVTAEGGQLNYQRGSSFTFESLIIQAGEGDFDGVVCDELTFKNCTIKGKLTLYGKATFINCTFDNTMANQYSIWTWGGTDVKFEGCTFNTNGKAILLYGRASDSNPTNLVVNSCIFNDRNSGAAGKAAIEIGNDYNATYTLTVKNATVNGFADGKNTNSKLWANKNSMDAAHLTVTIDGKQVH